MIKRVSFLNMSPEEWREQRRKTIGGSDAGTIIGLNPYDSPYNLWCVKTGRIIPEDISTKESVRLGHDLEQYVADRFTEETGLKLRRDNNFVYNTEIPFAHVQADRLVVGMNAGFEAKTSSSYEVVKMMREGKYRDSWYAQCVHGMMVTGADRWYLGVLVFGHGFYHFTIERDESEISALITAERDFWECVINDTPPAVDGSKATSDAIKAVYSDSHPGTIDLFSRDTVIDEIMAIRQQIKELEQLQEERENIIKADLGSYESGTTDKFNVSWKQQTRRSFDVKRFAEVNPEINLAPYYNETAFRKFDIRKKKGA